MMEPNYLFLYKDKELKELAGIDDFGDVDIGDTVVREFYLANMHPIHQMVQIYYEKFDDDLLIAEIPTELKPHHYIPVNITYHPSLKRREGLNTFIIFHGKERIPPG